MAVLQMQKVSICAMKRDRKAILEDLQSLGVMEISSVDLSEEGLATMDTMESRQLFERNATQADAVLEILDRYAPEKKGMLASLAGKDLVDRDAYMETAGNKEEIYKTIVEIQNLQKQMGEVQASIIRQETQMETLVPWLNLDVPLSFRGTKRTAMIIGSLDSIMTLEEIAQGIAQQNSELSLFDLQVISTDKDQTCIAVTCLKEEAESLENALRAMGFARPSQVIDEVPAAKLEQLKAEVEAYKNQIKEIELSIASYKESREKIQLYSDYFRIRAQKYEVLATLPQSKRTFIVTGFVPKKQGGKLQSTLEKKYELSMELEEIGEEEDAPVLLENGKVAATMEGIVASFGLPGKGEFDPSKIMFFFYIFLFGLMLSDAAYGLIMFLACFIVLKKFPRMDENMQKSFRMFMYCGLSTVFWGIMLGGYFGDAINVVSKTFFGHEVGIAPVWFTPINDPMKLLIFSMLFGLIHLYTGLALKGYICVKNKRYMDFFCDVVLWFMLLTGLILMLLPSELFHSISQMDIVFPGAVKVLSKWLAILGAVGIILMSGREKKNPLLRIALGAYDLYGVTGWLSDVLSYSRLLALGLATGVIASVINQMGSMHGKSVGGVILFIIVFIIGHVFNLLINVLGAYVHTCRLQYVEFFGKFYEGGGKEFTPFKENTKYVDIKEDIKL